MNLRDQPRRAEVFPLANLIYRLEFSVCETDGDASLERRRFWRRSAAPRLALVIYPLVLSSAWIGHDPGPDRPGALLSASD